MPEKQENETLANKKSKNYYLTLILFCDSVLTMKNEIVQKDKQEYCDWAIKFIKTHFAEFVKDEFFLENIRQIAELGFDKGYNSCSHAVKIAMDTVIDNF